ncbi:hypothetical protein AALP_AA1G259200 [Arabis alpina]|uniref:Transmembrane protein n=1 Tax=Arabis alpina TaxID=50452 RepID=A0A087HQQ6_ARAAL|nr:hypothetical protein AALP_AA1G259200 [Arabis alpina]
MKMKIEENLVFIMFKRASKVLCGNINLALFLFLCSLPLFCFLIFFELSLQTTVSLISQYLSRQLYFRGHYYYYVQDHALSEKLIPLLSQTFLLYLLPYSLLDLVTTTTIVSVSSIVYTSEEEPLGFGQLVRRTVEICQKRLGGCLITSFYVLLLSTFVFFGFFFAATNYFYIISLIGVGDYSYYHYISFDEDGNSYYYTSSSFHDPTRMLLDAVTALFHGAIFVVLLVKFSKWSAGWNMGLVISALEEEEEDGQGIYGTDALALSSYYGRGHEKHGQWVMLVFLVFALAMRIPCLCFKCSESSSGNGALYTSFYVDLRLKERTKTMEVKMEDKLSNMELLKRAAKLLVGNINLLLLLFLCSLPLFCFLIFFELSLQTTISATCQFLYKQLSFGKDLSENDPMLGFGIIGSLTSEDLPKQHSLSEDLSENDLIPWLIHTALLYFFPYTFLDLLTTTTVVAASSIVYTSEEKPLGVLCLVQRSIKICQNRVGGFLITYLCVLLLSTSVFLFFCFLFLYYFLGFFSNPINYFASVSLIRQTTLDPVAVLLHALVVLVHSVLFMFLTAKFTKWSAGWNMGLVVSVLEEEDENGKGIYGRDALSLSAWYRRGHEKRDLWMMLMFLVFGLAMRMPCLYSKCSESSSRNGVLYTSLYVGLICFGNVVKWVACVVCYHDCKTRFLRKKHDVEQAKLLAT